MPAEKPFRFKHFTVAHDQCAHKVGTDGTLLGAWVEDDSPGTILDVGTGSGLIALMLGQRFASAYITGIELDHYSAQQAKANAKGSPFANRMKIIEGDFLDFEFKNSFDLVVSNPPFFKGAYSTGKDNRDKARHEFSLPQSAFIEKVTIILSETGKFSVVLPLEEGQLFIENAEKKRLYLLRQTEVSGKPEALPNRLLLEFGKRNLPCRKDTMTIRNSDGSHSEAYRNLTKDFYLNF